MECKVGEIATDLGCLPDTPAAFVSKFLGIAAGLIGGLGFLGIIYASYLILTSQGDPGQLNKGKRYLVSSIIGVLLVLFSVFFTKLAAVGILGLPGFK